MLTWIEKILRFWCTWLDKAVSVVIDLAYKLFIDISNTNIFSDDVFKMFNQRVYALLAVFMLFKLSFSLISYLINPDSAADKSKGTGKLITNVFVTLVLIIAVPTVFDLAYSLQGKIIKNNILPKIILGVSSDGVGIDDESTGQLMSYTIYTGFITPNPNYPGMGDICADIYKNSDLIPTSGCGQFMSKELGDNFNILRNAVRDQNATLLLSPNLVVWPSQGEETLFTYVPIISTICAGLVAWTILVFCIDVAIRVVKLGFLQLIAPIPIISYIDPKSSTDGMFKKWLKVCFSTYMSLFVRVAAIAFAVFIINIINTTDPEMISSPGTIITNPLIKILIILGALIFAKQIPKLIEDILGIKLDGEFTLNPMKKINEAPVIGKAAASLGGGLAGAIAGHRVGATGQGMLAGLFSGASAVPWMGNKDGKSAFSSGANAAYKRLIGKDFVNFSPEKAILGMSGKSAVDKVGDPLKNAYGVLNHLNTQLNVASHGTAEEATKLQSRGIDLKNLSGEKNRLAANRSDLANKLSSVQGRRSEIMDKLNSSTSDYNMAKESLSSGNIGKNTALYGELQSTINDYEKLQSEVMEYSKIEEQYSNVGSAIESIEKYESSIATETSLRKEISTVEKDIKDLSTEKSQRERFYNYDPAPTEDVNKKIDKYK